MKIWIFFRLMPASSSSSDNESDNGDGDVDTSEVDTDELSSEDDDNDAPRNDFLAVYKRNLLHRMQNITMMLPTKGIARKILDNPA